MVIAERKKPELCATANGSREFSDLIRIRNEGLQVPYKPNRRGNKFDEIVIDVEFFKNSKARINKTKYTVREEPFAESKSTYFPILSGSKLSSFSSSRKATRRESSQTESGMYVILFSARDKSVN